METIIVYVDDAAYAQPLLAAAVQTPQADRAHWIVVACAPRITHRVSRFVSNRSRENWRSKWAEKLFHALAPTWEGKLPRVTSVLARVPLQDLLESLQAEHGRAQLLDLRRPKMQSEPASSVAGAGPSFKLAGTLSSLAAVWTMLLGEALAA